MTDDLLGYLLLVDVLQPVPGDVLGWVWSALLLRPAPSQSAGLRRTTGSGRRLAKSRMAPLRRAKRRHKLSELCCQRRRVFRSKRADVGVALLEACDGFV